MTKEGGQRKGHFWGVQGLTRAQGIYGMGARHSFFGRTLPSRRRLRRFLRPFAFGNLICSAMRACRHAATRVTGHDSACVSVMIRPRKKKKRKVGAGVSVRGRFAECRLDLSRLSWFGNKARNV